MSVYFGQLGRLVKLPYVTSQSVDAEERLTVQTTAEGRVRVQARPSRGRRTWSLDIKHATPDVQGSLMGFVNGEWGVGPFVFVSADAPVTNLLTPEAASCDPDAAVLGSGAILTGTPPMLTPDGWVGRSYAKNTANAVFFGPKVPVVPGVKVTASAYVTGTGGAVRIQWYDAAGGNLSTVTSNVTSTATAAVRSYVTATPPAGAASARVGTSFTTTQACRPALTWTTKMFDWSDGQGCLKSVLMQPSRSVVKAINNPATGRWSDVSFTVQEVG